MSRIQLQFPEKIAFTTQVNITISDINYGGHLGNDRFLTLMQEARLQWLKLLGYKDEKEVEPPVGIIVADAAILSERVDGAVFVIHVGKTRREVIQQAIYNLRQAEANLFGAVLNRVSKKTHSYYYHGYYYKRSENDPADQANANWLQRWAKQLPFVK